MAAPRPRTVDGWHAGYRRGRDEPHSYHLSLDSPRRTELSAHLSWSYDDESTWYASLRVGGLIVVKDHRLDCDNADGATARAAAVTFARSWIAEQREALTAFEGELAKQPADNEKAR